MSTALENSRRMYQDWYGKIPLSQELEGIFNFLYSDLCQQAEVVDLSTDSSLLLSCWESARRMIEDSRQVFEGATAAALLRQLFGAPRPDLLLADATANQLSANELQAKAELNETVMGLAPEITSIFAVAISALEKRIATKTEELMSLQAQYKESKAKVSAVETYGHATVIYDVTDSERRHQNKLGALEKEIGFYQRLQASVFGFIGTLDQGREMILDLVQSVEPTPLNPSQAIPVSMSATA
jgi:hypothetical protein